MSDAVTERALVAAGRSVAHRGVAGTTLEVVAREAGVSRATIYRHFPQGRQQLFDELVEFEVDRFFRDLYSEVEGLTSLDEVLERGLRHAHHAVGRHFLLQTVLREDPSILEPRLSLALSVVERNIAQVFEPYLTTGSARDERADFLARMSLDYISTQGRWNFEDPLELKQLIRDELLAWRGVRQRRMTAARVRPLRKVHDTSARGRIIEATLTQLAEGHLGRFTVDSIVKNSSVSRATVYRTFPGGRDAMVVAALDREGARLFAAVADAMASEDTLQRCLLAGLTTVWHHVANHEAICGVLATQPEMIQRQLRFESATRTYYVSSTFAQPLLGRWLDTETAGRLAEWMCRICVSYWLNPAPYVDISSPASVATFYSRHLAPGVEQLSAESS